MSPYSKTDRIIAGNNQDFGHMKIVDCEIFRPEWERLRKNATIGTLAQINPVSLQLLCGAVTTGLQSPCSCRAPTTSSYAYTKYGNVSVKYVGKYPTEKDFCRSKRRVSFLNTLTRNSCEKCNYI